MSTASKSPACSARKRLCAVVRNLNIHTHSLQQAAGEFLIHRIVLSQQDFDAAERQIPHRTVAILGNRIRRARQFCERADEYGAPHRFGDHTVEYFDLALGSGGRQRGQQDQRRRRSGQAANLLRQPGGAGAGNVVIDQDDGRWMFAKHRFILLQACRGIADKREECAFRCELTLQRLATACAAHDEHTYAVQTIADLEGRVHVGCGQLDGET